MAWITRETALARLGVKPQTLYAYVSRGRIAARPSPDAPRESLYAKADIDKLARARRSGRRRSAIAADAIAWGDPMLETKITTVRDGRLLYKGRDAVELSQRATLEDIAAFLWGEAAATSTRAVNKITGNDAKARGFVYLARAAAIAPASFGRAPALLAREGHDLLHGLVDAIVAPAGRDALIHRRLAAMWGLSLRRADLVRRALTLVADHELNPSTFAARVAASTGASLAAAALAGYATLTGPLHGQASAGALDFLRRALADGADQAIADWSARGLRLPGYGHPLYPSGDPRAAALLAALRPAGALAAAIEAGVVATDEPANIDMALAAMTLACDLPDDAPFLIFAVGRMVGWVAHAIEQQQSGRPIRPRATYVGDFD